MEQFQTTYHIDPDPELDPVRVLRMVIGVDGGMGLWSQVYRSLADVIPVGILDFYHAIGHLWKATTALFDRRSSIAKQWFQCWRPQLRHR